MPYKKKWKNKPISSCKKNIHQAMTPTSTLLLHSFHPVLLLLTQSIRCSSNFTIQFLQFLFLSLQSNLQFEMLILLVLQHQLGTYFYALLLYYAGLQVLDRRTKPGDISETCTQKGDICRVGIGMLQLRVRARDGWVGFRGVKEVTKLREDTFEKFVLYLRREVGVRDSIERLSQISQLLHFHGKHYKIIRQILLRQFTFSISKHHQHTINPFLIIIYAMPLIFIPLPKPTPTQTEKQSFTI